MDLICISNYSQKLNIFCKYPTKYHFAQTKMSNYLKHMIV